MELVWIALLGGALALDATSVGQFMLSRPLVAGAIVGSALGNAPLGLGIGALLELYLLVSFPSGGARFPEGATATVVAVACASAMDGPGAVPLGVGAGLVWGQVGGFTITGLRRLNGKLVPEPGADRPERVATAHMGAVALDFLRGALVTFVGVASGTAVLRPLAATWPLGAADSGGLLLVGGAVSGGILLRSLGGFRRRGLLFAGGLVLGLVGTRLLG